MEQHSWQVFWTLKIFIIYSVFNTGEGVAGHKNYIEEAAVLEELRVGLKGIAGAVLLLMLSAVTAASLTYPADKKNYSD